MQQAALIARVSLCAIVLACASCAPEGDRPAESSTLPVAASSVWVMDLIRTFPGMQAEYLRGIEANWGGARRLAVGRGVVHSYQAFAIAPDSTLGWDVILLTEYVDSSAFLNREEAFAEIFELPEYLAARVTSTRPSSELRSFFLTELFVKPVVRSDASGTPRTP